MLLGGQAKNKHSSEIGFKQKVSCFYLFSSSFLLHKIYGTFSCMFQNTWLWTNEFYLVFLLCTNIICIILLVFNLFGNIFRDRKEKK